VLDLSERKRAEEALRASERVARGQVEALVQSLDALATAPASDQFILRMLSTIGRLLGTQWVAVWLWLVDDATDSLVLRAAIRRDNSDLHPFVKDPLFWKGDGGLQEIFSTGVAIPYEDVETDPRIPNALRKYFRSEGTRKILRLPMLVGGKVKGLITIGHAERPPYGSAEIELAQALAHQAMLAIQTRQAATLEERNRMARDIHDTLAQGFTGVIIQLDTSVEALRDEEPEAAAKHIGRARELARESLTEARRSVHALRTQALERAQLPDALKAIITNTTAGTSLQSDFQLEGEPRKLKHAVEENLLRIGQEALTNTLKHACATTFQARLSFDSDAVLLELRDNGKGFVVDNVNGGGIGLIGMKERAEQIGATLAVTSEPGAGTTIIAVLPSNSQ
jgi:signal transduction histidine kinase